jgi:hypothetical protein
MRVRNNLPHISNIFPASRAAEITIVQNVLMVSFSSRNLQNTIELSFQHNTITINILCKAYKQRDGLPLKMVQGLLLLAFGTSFMDD